MLQISLETRVSDLPLVGSVYTKRLENIGIFTVKDLLYYFPFRYEDLSAHKAIVDLNVGDKVTIQARILQITKFRTKTGKTIVKAIVNDGENSIDVTWFNQDYLLTVLKQNQLVNFSGKISLFSGKQVLSNPTYEIIKSNIVTPIHTDRLVPIYSETGGITNKWLRAKIHQILSVKPAVSEYLPGEISEKESFVDLEKALNQIHFPDNFEGYEQAKRRLAFDELLFLHLRNLKLASKSSSSSKSLALKTKPTFIGGFEKTLPFVLTASQKESVLAILNDLAQEKPMHRLLQGEVGSGKTVVSAFAIKMCVENGFQAAFLAPTEILARQHYKTLETFLGSSVSIKLVTGSSKPELNDFNVVVGTHALLNQVEHLNKLALVVIDEQQRFGVVQRSILQQRDPQPHLLTMTATPIPRTLALTLYGQMDISHLEELPSGRKLVKTYLVPKVKRSDSYEFIRKEIKDGGQVFVLCPLIEESESLLTVKSAKAEFERLHKDIFPDLKVDLLHGKMKSSEKQAVLEKFRDRQTDILVTTPVVEVGIDIPNASIMVIEAAERFGLASLHQLRGRVGRGNRQSYCLLFTENRSIRVQERLKLLEKYHNGLQLAEMDLERRGPGDIYGILQSGQLNLKLANTADLELIIKSKDWAEKLSKESLPKELNKIVEKELEENAQMIGD